MAESTDVERAVNSLEDGTEEEQIETLGELANLASSQPDALIPYLDDICLFADDDVWNIRSRVARILANAARHDSSTMTPHLSVIRTLLTDNNPYVLSYTTAAIMEITSASSTTLLDTSDRLLELLTYENSQASDAARSTRMRAVLALGYLADDDPTLAAQLDEPFVDRLDDVSPKVRAATVTTLTRLGIAYPEAFSMALAHLPTRLDDPDLETRRYAVDAYVYFRHKQPSAIVQPNTVAPALRAAAEEVELDAEEAERVTETCQYLDQMARGSS